ncbi:citrate/2-methylcitrate synthase [Gimesia chilikensis]|uniref:Citrate synthase n=1 Tax=Gimesia chilikensis TaxID=2605989 RepID=A0A517PX47_9PLAN|nr:citrate/2-methylcitrate synthase [Gimesia chilikensis]QDT23939.1 Citrate synthase 2 [Gimesia chilikensis]
MERHPYRPGLTGIIATETEISQIQDGLTYRGYLVDELAREAMFLEVAYLLLHGELPSHEEMADFQTMLIESGQLPYPVLKALESIPPHIDMMEVVRSGVSLLAHFDPQMEYGMFMSDISNAQYLLAMLPQLISFRYHYVNGKKPVVPNFQHSYAGSFWYMLKGDEPTQLEEEAFNALLISQADYGLAPSTFAARVVASTGSPLYSSINAAIGSLNGQLHCSSGAGVLDALQEAMHSGNAEEWACQEITKGRRVLGFQHSPRKPRDPRAAVLKNYCVQVADALGLNAMEATADAIEDVMAKVSRVHPRVEWHASRLLHYLGFEPELFTPIFAVSRMAGWVAHIVEQTENNHLYQPLSRYVGMDQRKYKPMPLRS